MNTEAARTWLIKSSLIATGIAFVFYLLAPALHYPLTYDQTPRIFELILPVFLGYVGTATHFLFHGGEKQSEPKVTPEQLLQIIVKGPLIIFAIGWVALTVAFGLTNRSSAPDGSGMSIDQLATFLTSLLSLLTISTGVAVSYLFSLEKN